MSPCPRPDLFLRSRDRNSSHRITALHAAPEKILKKISKKIDKILFRVVK